ncbi:hypothetical protein D3C73_1074520 [compost metagenome]
MLDDGRDGLDRQRVCTGQGISDVLLIADPEIPLSGCDKRSCCAIRGLNNINVQAGRLVIALIQSHIQTRVVRIGCPIENDRCFV